MGTVHLSLSGKAIREVDIMNQHVKFLTNEQQSKINFGLTAPQYWGNYPLASNVIL